MPLPKDAVTAARVGMRWDAQNGGLAPNRWVTAPEEENDEGGGSLVCVVAAFARQLALFFGSPELVREKFRPDITDNEIYAILRAAGITEREMRRMRLQQVWMRFDCEMDDVYNARDEDRDAYIAESKLQVECFIEEVLNKIPVIGDEPRRGWFERRFQALKAMAARAQPIDWPVPEPIPIKA